MKDLSVIILSYNTQKLTLNCLKSILKNTQGIDYEIIVLDNASKDDSPEAIKKLKAKNPRIRLIENKTNLGFAGGNNRAAEGAQGEFLLFLNSDTIIESSFLKEMIEWMRVRPEVGVTTCALKNEDGGLQATGGYFPTLLRVFSWMTIQDFPLVDKMIKPFHPMKEKSFTVASDFYQKEQELDWVTGAFLMIRKKVFESVKGWDKDYFMYTEDVDLCYQVKKKGHQVWFLPQYHIIHYGGASSTDEYPILSEFKGIKLFYQKHFPKWQYPVLRIFLKIGALGRIVVFGILEGKKGVKKYVKALIQA